MVTCAPVRCSACRASAPIAAPRSEDALRKGRRMREGARFDCSRNAGRVDGLIAVGSGVNGGSGAAPRLEDALPRHITHHNCGSLLFFSFFLIQMKHYDALCGKVNDLIAVGSGNGGSGGAARLSKDALREGEWLTIEWPMREGQWLDCSGKW